MGLERIDTHGHIELPVPGLSEAAVNGQDLETCQPLIDSRVVAAGCRELYGIDPREALDPTQKRELLDRAAEVRARGDSEAFHHGLEAAHIRHMLAFSDHNPQDSPLLSFSPRLSLLAYIDAAIVGHGQAYCPDFSLDDYCYYDRLLELFGDLTDLDSYLGALDAAIDSWRGNGVVGMKMSFAYTIGLDFADPSIEEARAAFRKRGDMTLEESRVVQHFAVRHALLACQRNEIPVVVHTGFQIWGHADLRQSNPAHLHRLLIDERYKRNIFVLLHGGNPYVGETTYLAAMFPNVVIDFTWISWMTRTRFRMALAEWLEVVPQSKFCWGADCPSSPEPIVGIDRIVREEIANVLEDLVSRRIIYEHEALSFLDQTYINTPRRLFGVS
jgi:hypothetical protein